MPPSRSPEPPRIRQLAASDDRSSFTSGNEPLDRYFRLYAGQNQFRHHLGVTYIAVDSRRITGFMTVAAGEMETEKQPHGMPVLRLARLAVTMKTSVGCTGVVVDAKSDAVPFYSHYGFTAFETFEGASPERPQTTAMFLAVRKIEMALTTTARPQK